MKTKHVNIPVFIPELACPFQCIFCNQQKISGQQHIPDILEIRNKIEEHLGSIDFQKTSVQIAFFGGSFTALPIIEQKKYLEIAYDYLKKYPVDGIRISTRPDYINTDNLQILRDYGVRNIELGAQSLDDEVLKTSGRGHSVAQVEEAMRLLKKYNFETGLQMMIGLPGDTNEKALATANKIIELGAEETRIYPTLVIAGTVLHSMFLKNNYKVLTLEEARRITAQIYLLFIGAKVKVLRVGLHPSTELESGKSLVAGPFHPKFKELVMSYIWNEKLQNIPIHASDKILNLKVHPSQLNFAIGFESENRNLLQQTFLKVNFKPDSTLETFEFRSDLC